MAKISFGSVSARAMKPVGGTAEAQHPPAAEIPKFQRDAYHPWRAVKTTDNPRPTAVPLPLQFGRQGVTAILRKAKPLTGYLTATERERMPFLRERDTTLRKLLAESSNDAVRREIKRQRVETPGRLARGETDDPRVSRQGVALEQLEDEARERRLVIKAAFRVVHAEAAELSKNACVRLAKPVFDYAEKLDAIERATATELGLEFQPSPTLCAVVRAADMLSKGDFQDVFDGPFAVLEAIEKL